MRRVAVFAKWPRRGAVKTRLHPVLGSELADRLYLAMLNDALGAAGASSADRCFVFWAERPANAEPFPVPAGMRSCDQTDRHEQRDLGARLENAFDELLTTAGDRAVILGADIPGLDARSIDQAFAELNRSELVLAPARDGGYSLIGLARRAPELFRGVAWSTATVLGETLARAETLRLRTTLLGRADDLDDSADLMAFLARALREPELAPHTRAALREMKLLA